MRPCGYLITERENESRRKKNETFPSPNVCSRRLFFPSSSRSQRAVCLIENHSNSRHIDTLSIRGDERHIYRGEGSECDQVQSPKLSSTSHNFTSSKVLEKSEVYFFECFNYSSQRLLLLFSLARGPRWVQAWISVWLIFRVLALLSPVYFSIHKISTRRRRRRGLFEQSGIYIKMYIQKRGPAAATKWEREEEKKRMNFNGKESERIAMESSSFVRRVFHVKECGNTHTRVDGLFFAFCSTTHSHRSSELEKKRACDLNNFQHFNSRSFFSLKFLSSSLSRVSPNSSPIQSGCWLKGRRGEGAWRETRTRCCCFGSERDRRKSQHTNQH